jgi:hypothetical protein
MDLTVGRYHDFWDGSVLELPEATERLTVKVGHHSASLCRDESKRASIDSLAGTVNNTTSFSFEKVRRVVRPWILNIRLNVIDNLK